MSIDQKNYNKAVFRKYLKQSFVLLKWPDKKSGLQYSVIKRELCSNISISAKYQTLKLTCSANNFDNCEIIKACSHKNCSDYYTVVVLQQNKQAT